MGGLVGGLYATGKSADELHKIVKDANWPLLLGGGTPYPDLSFRRKEDAREIPNAIQIGLKHGANLPPGLNTGHQVGLLIDRETLPYSAIPSFNDLPIPFRCVATEIISGKPYVFKDGSLSDAMRATMSIPGVFAPVRRGNQIFVDGGLVDNLPTDVVRKMGADLVIAVHLQISPASAEEIQSAFSVLGRSVALVIAETEIRGMAGADLIVKADVEKYSTMDYEKSDALIKIGYESAEEKADRFNTDGGRNTARSRLFLLIIDALRYRAKRRGASRLVFPLRSGDFIWQLAHSGNTGHETHSGPHNDNHWRISILTL